MGPPARWNGPLGQRQRATTIRLIQSCLMEQQTGTDRILDLALIEVAAETPAVHRPQDEALAPCLPSGAQCLAFGSTLGSVDKDNCELPHHFR
jgi:hypothetical protein